MSTPQETAEGLLYTAAEYLKHGRENLSYAAMVLETLEQELRRTPRKPEPAATDHTAPPCN